VTTTLELYSEDIDRVHILYALDLPGCYSEGITEAEAIGNFPAAFTTYNEWLSGRGETVHDAPTLFEIAGRFASYTIANGYDVNGLFEPERAPPSREFVARCRRLLNYSGTELIGAAQAIPASRGNNALAAGERSPRQVIEHVALAEYWYLSHFVDIPKRVLANHPTGSLNQFEAVHGALINWLANIGCRQLGSVVMDREEEWSVPKLLRRALWHERTHTVELSRFVRG
jgi:predicted RNase H-like HicB family nuclease